MGQWPRLAALICVAFGCAALAQPAVASPPAIESQWVTSLDSSNATLNARIDPDGLLTKYKLQIDTTGNFRFYQNDGCALHPPGWACTQAIVEGDPLPPGLVNPQEMTLSPEAASQHVSVNLAAIGAVLQPETTYHFRAIAANSQGFAYGPDLTFTTPAPGTPPIDEPEPGLPISEPEPPPADEVSDRESDAEAPPTKLGTAARPQSASSTPPTSAASPAARKKKRLKHRRRAQVAVHGARPIG